LQLRSHAAPSRRNRNKVAPGAHAILVLDQAGWHGAKALVVPSNISLVPLPPRAPELNGQENIWQFMRQNWLSNRIFKSFDDIVDHCCYAWNTLIHLARLPPPCIRACRLLRPSKLLSHQNGRAGHDHAPFEAEHTSR